jgi:hypothetical protein
MSLRASLLNKMGEFTKVPRLNNVQNANETIEIARYGPGKIMGASIFVIPELKLFQPFTIKCASHDGLLLRISSYEFEKKILSFKYILRDLRENALNELLVIY